MIFVLYGFWIVLSLIFSLWYLEPQLFFSPSFLALKYTFICVVWSDLKCRQTGSWGGWFFVLVSLSLKQLQLDMNKTFQTANSCLLSVFFFCLFYFCFVSEITLCRVACLISVCKLMTKLCWWMFILSMKRSDNEILVDCLFTA